MHKEAENDRSLAPYLALVGVQLAFGSFPVIGNYFNREVEMDGGAFTLLRADHTMRSDVPYEAVHGAGYRGIYDLADPDHSLYIISTGQSGNVLSPWYASFAGRWAKVEYITIPTRRESIGPAHRLVLKP